MIPITAQLLFVPCVSRVPAQSAPQKRAVDSTIQARVNARMERRRRAIADSPPCRAPELLDTAAWVEALPASRVSVRLPLALTRDTTFTSYHGGAKWRDADRSFALENGWWSPRAAYDSTAGSCRFQTRYETFVVDIARDSTGYDWEAIPADTVWEPSVHVVGHATRAEDIKIFWTALTTLHWIVR